MKSHDEIANLLRKHGGDGRRIERHLQMKHLLLTTIAAVLVGGLIE